MVVNKRILLHGCYNTQNFGDLLIADLLSRHIKNIVGYPPICFDVHPEVRSKLSCRAAHDFLSILPAAAAVLGGGGYLNDGYEPKKTRRLLRYSIPSMAWRYTRTPYVITGVGVGPSYTPCGASRIRQVCCGAREILVRDDESVDLLIEMGVPEHRIQRCADLVLSLTCRDIPVDATLAAEKLLPRLQDGYRRLCLHVQSVKPDIQATIISHACDALRAELKNGEVEMAIIFDHGSDGYNEVQTLVSDSRARINVIPPQSFWTTVALINQCHATLTTKLHVGIVSWVLGIPPFGISVHPKTRRFYQQIGRGDFQWDIARGVEKAPIFDWLNYFSKNPSSFKENDSEIRLGLVALAQQGFDAVTRMLVDESLAAV